MKCKEAFLSVFPFFQNKHPQYEIIARVFGITTQSAFNGMRKQSFNFGTYGAETRKKQKRRERFYDTKFKHNPNIIPKYSKIKRGSRGGWIKNPLKEVTKNSGSNFEYEKEIEKQVAAEEKECIENLIKMRKHFEEKEKRGEGEEQRNEQIREKQKENKKDMFFKTENTNSSSSSSSSSIHNSFNFFSLCEQFINVKKEIIHRIENPQHFVDNHITSLINEYDNINNLPEQMDEYRYAKTPSYIKSSKQNINKKENNTISWIHKKENEGIKLQELENVKDQKDNFRNGSTIAIDHCANEMVENFFNYADDDELDVNYLDTFSILNTIDRNRKLGSYFASWGASFILYNDCIIPSKFREGTLKEYYNTRTACSLFDKSYQLILKFTGKDAVYICNQFITGDLNDLKDKDISYSCIVDNKSFVIDTCYTIKGDNAIFLVTSGHFKKGIYEFLSDYILFCKDSGMDVNIEVEINKRVLSLQGPFANMAFNDLIDYYEWEKENDNKKFLSNVINQKKQKQINEPCLFFKRNNLPTFINPPYMSYNNITLVKKNDNGSFTEHELLFLRIGDSGEDGYEFIVDNHISDLFVNLFLKHNKIKVAGAYALDMLRMEAGFPLFGIDIIKNVSPIAASLSWTLKYKKIKERSIFGYSNLLKEYCRNPKFLRIGIICSELLFKTCKILSLPYKEPIGFITSSTWSPLYKKRIAQGYIKREFAKNNEKVLISIPTNIPDELSKKKKYKILRSRSSHKYAVANICSLPFVEHRY